MEKSNDNGYIKYLPAIAAEDARFLAERDTSYGSSWKKRGGSGAFHMLARKWDRLENILSYEDGSKFDIFSHMTAEKHHGGSDGTVLAEVRDLRRYLLLVEAEMVERGVVEPPPVPVIKHTDIRSEDTLTRGSATAMASKMSAGSAKIQSVIAAAVSAEDFNKHAPRLRRQQNHTELMTLPKEDQLRYRWVDGEQSYVLQTGKVVDGIFLPEKIQGKEYNLLLVNNRSIENFYNWDDYRNYWYLNTDSDND